MQPNAAWLFATPTPSPGPGPGPGPGPAPLALELAPAPVPSLALDPAPGLAPAPAQLQQERVLGAPKCHPRPLPGLAVSANPVRRTRPAVRHRRTGSAVTAERGVCAF